MSALITNRGAELEVTDFFCGAGGASSGLVEAGFRVVLAANHWDRAIQSHAMNHVQTEHLCADVNNLDMRRIPRTSVLWASVICTEASPAGGRRRKPTKGQLQLLEYGSINDAGFERTRATALDVIRASEVHRYEVVVVENVVDFALEWELFDWWRTGMHTLGYSSQITCVSSAHISGEGNPGAPQWRDRIYITFTRNGVPIPDLAPRPLAWCPTCGVEVEGVQAWRNGNTIGKYRQQYDYRCPNTACRHQVVEPYVRPAAAAIDWTNPGRRLGDRTRPLAASTMRKIRAGLAEYATEPSVISVNHSDESGRPYPARSWPLATRTGRIGDALLAPPGAFIAELRGGGSSHRPVTEPLATITSSHGFRHHGLVIPYRRACKPYPTSVPMPAVSTRDAFSLIQSPPTATQHQGGLKTWAGEIDVDDCHFRMITPREQLNGQRFDPSYIVTGNQGEQTMQAGNAVSVNVATWIGRRIAAALDGPRTH